MILCFNSVYMMLNIMKVFDNKLFHYLLPENRLQCQADPVQS